MLRIGPSKRLFAAHESILSISPFFASRCRSFSSRTRAPPRHPPARRIDLPDEQPEVFACVLEFLYKGDYSPRLRRDQEKGCWVVEGAMSTEGEGGSSDDHPGATMFCAEVGGLILRDTAVYCAAEQYALPTLQRLALRKQGLHVGISCSTILASARYAYAHTPDTESKLRAHYLALIVRCRETFKQSGTMQMEMERGGKMFFDLFVALCNHMDDMSPAAAVQASMAQ
ncbi:hypothetical protein N7510_010555 [Penicillium lagena]|uniref:uncharacterized protein n=1 Tax=Penicillium lagena TaxID=94218 RepID=UPI00253FBDD4|nr:uncharacterized protein N7510_010555 [Penicillium lagena]KAJ5601021.1 hypothetical protein N7510_010555 [Penicillium lagena]